jgi:small subunit ribosomal protein S1
METANKLAEFEALLEKSFESGTPKENTVVNGTIIAIEAGQAIIDIGYKMEGRIDVREFTTPASKDGELKIGDKVEVYLERVENAKGEAVVSREKARREEAWDKLEKAAKTEERVDGIIFGKVKGGFTVDLDGAIAFLPGSQVDVRPIKDTNPLMNVPQPFQVLKMDRKRGNIVVSRRAVLEESRAEQRAELVGNLAEGNTVDGIVKNITDYGAFVDLGGLDGLLHVTDIAWKRINHPSEMLNLGDSIKVQIIKVNKETNRISLGMKQLETDPWADVEGRFPIGSNQKGIVTNITDYGAFVELEAGVEGLVHVSEMSWTKKNVHPGKILSTSQEVEVMVLELDKEKRRVSLGLKQIEGNPWQNFAQSNTVGAILEVEIKNITEFGLFVGLGNDIDGMIHLSDLDWEKTGEEALKDHKKGDVIKAKVTDIDVEKERISLSIKALERDPFDEVSKTIKKGSTLTAVVSKVDEAGIEVDCDGVKGFIKRSDLSRDRNEQRPERFSEGDKVDAKVVNLDKASRKFNLSIKALELAEEKEAVEQYGSTDSGASLGDILGAALKDQDQKS